MAQNVKSLISLAKRKVVQDYNDGRGHHTQSTPPRPRVYDLTPEELELVGAYQGANETRDKLSRELMAAGISDYYGGNYKPWKYGKTQPVVEGEKVDHWALVDELENLELAYALGKVTIDDVRKRVGELIARVEPKLLTGGTDARS